MKAAIEVANKKEAEFIRIALDDPTMRVFVTIMGALGSLHNDALRTRVLTFVNEYFAEESAQKQPSNIG